LNVEVAVIGAGPAGCAAALALRAAGVATALIDAGKRLEKPTETATPHLQRLLRELQAQDALAACTPCLGIAAHWGGRGTFQPAMLSPFGTGWFVDRAPFDGHLRQAARKAGAGLIAARAARIEFHPAGASVALADGGRLQARWLVLANGAPSLAAKITGAPHRNVDPMVAFWAALPLRLGERLIHVEAGEHGWWYLCPGADGISYACFMTDARAARALKPSAAQRWLALFAATRLARLAGGCAPIAVKAAPTGVAALQVASGAGWTAVGDAAVRLDPLGSAGLTAALDGGRRAGAAIAQMLRGDAAGLDGYRRWTAGLLKDFMRQRAAHYAAEAELRGSAFWRARLRQAA
jgi:flavin-dependent dehydrogenase